MNNFHLAQRYASFSRKSSRNFPSGPLPPTEDDVWEWQYHRVASIDDCIEFIDTVLTELQGDRPAIEFVLSGPVYDLVQLQPHVTARIDDLLRRHGIDRSGSPLG